MADLVTRLTLNDKEFNDKIQKSKKELQQFQGLQSNLVGVVGKFAGAIGLAGGAMEGLNQMMKNSQTFGDNMTTTMNVAKDSVNEFFGALATGDFTSFINGIDNIIAKSREATAALDQLGNTRISYNYFNSEYDRQMSDAMLVAKNKKNTTEQRDEGFKQWDAVLNEKAQAAQALYDQSINTAMKVAIKGTAIQSATLKEMENILKLDILPASERDKEKQRLIQGYEEYLEAVDKVKAKYDVRNAATNNAAVVKSNNDSKKIELKRLAEVNKEYILYNKMLQKMSDEELQGLTDIAAQANATAKAIKDQRREYNESIVEYQNSQKTTTSNNKGGSTVKVTPIIPDGSIAAIDKKISELNKQIQLEVDPITRTELYKEIERLTKEKKTIEFQYKYPNAPTGKLEPTTNLSDMVKPDLKNIKLPEIKKPITNKDVKITNDYAESLNAVATIMGNVANATNDSAAAYLTWIGNLLSSVAAAIPAIQALTAAKTGEAVAEGVSSAAQTPVVGWLLAGAAAAAVIAAIASTPKFADGGIFQSSLTSGDMNLARLNGGEMILNTGQQARLFNLLDGKGSLMGGGDVKFTIEGKQLVGVLSNYNNRINHIR